IPRPRNAFILFRCDYSQQRQNAKGDLDQSQNDLSRAVGQMWRRMTVAQRAPWVILAEEEKQQHAVMYPGYKY
ncbi:high mobility group box domain-containing protein, partial [Mycena amicta]